MISNNCHSKVCSNNVKDFPGEPSELVSASFAASEPAQPSGSLSLPAPGLSYRRAVNKAHEIRHNLPKSVKVKLKILFSLAMFASLPLFLKIDLQKTAAALWHANGYILALTAFIVVVSNVINARRWQIITRSLGFNKPFAEYVEYWYVGMFFNLFLPSTVGGDFSRCYYISKSTGK